MPCGSDVPDVNPVEELRKEIRGLLVSEDQKKSALKAELDLVTRLLCELLRQNPELVKGGELSEWWQRHQVYDDSRQIRD